MTAKRLFQIGIVLLLCSSPIASPQATGADVDVVTEWNQLLQATMPATAGPTAPRYFATLHVAMFDAINAIEREYQPYRVRLGAWAGGSPEAAATQAAHDVLAALIPAQAEAYDAALAARIGRHPSAFARRGAAVGALVATEILAWRQDDGWTAPPSPYVLPPFPGRWQPTPPTYSPAGLTQAPGVKPFALLTPTQYLPPPPPALTSEEYASDFNEVKMYGVVNSVARTPEQTDTSRLWAGIATSGVGTATTLFAIWNNVTRDMIADHHLSLVDAARVYALVNVSIHDGIQSSATSKFVYGLWRPVTAIQRADEDLNDATDADATWLPLLPTPPYPSYGGNMSCVGASAARTLELTFDSRDIPVVATWQQSGGLPDVSHTLPGAWQLAEEQARSRIYGGIHFEFDTLAGKQIGTRVADYVYQHYARRRR